MKRLEEFAEQGLVTNTPALEAVARKYTLSISQEMLLKVHNPAIYAQFVPTENELITTKSELEDPIGDDIHSPITGLVHRYSDRALIKLTTLCPVYCRFCFRRETVGKNENATLSKVQLENIFAYLKNHSEIKEVILTGGDPLILSAKRLKEIFSELAKIPSLKIIRIHTRVPVVSPELITNDLLSAIDNNKQITVIGIHSNHASEWGEKQAEAAKKLSDKGFPLLSQTVLLKGVNNDVNSLKTLFQTFIEHKIMPYYLHHPDKAKGTSHFRVNIDEGIALMQALQGKISGYALPKYILDIPQGFGKIPLHPPFIAKEGKNWQVLDIKGQSHPYED